MTPAELAVELQRLERGLKAWRHVTTRIFSEPLGPSLWLSVQVEMRPGDDEVEVRDTVLSEIESTMTWYHHSESTIITTFSKGRGRKRRDGSDPKRTAEISVSLREPPSPIPACDICGQPGRH